MEHHTQLVGYWRSTISPSPRRWTLNNKLKHSVYDHTLKHPEDYSVEALRKHINAGL